MSIISGWLTCSLLQFVLATGAIVPALITVNVVTVMSLMVASVVLHYQEPKDKQ